MRVLAARLIVGNVGDDKVTARHERQSFADFTCAQVATNIANERHLQHFDTLYRELLQAAPAFSAPASLAPESHWRLN